MKLTKFQFFKNTPFTDLMNTTNFETTTIRDQHFEYPGNYQIIDFEVDFNFIRDKSFIRVPMQQFGYMYTDFDGVNYCRFLHGFDNKLYYAFVMDDMNYVNDNCLEVNILIDPFMTECQGSVLEDNAKNVTIERQHLPKSVYKEYLQYLRTNSDLLEVNSGHYVYQNATLFREFHVIFTCSYDLSVSFQDADEIPNIETSAGQIFDNIISPLNLYVMTRDDFTSMMDKLRPYPWVSENIKTCIIFPTKFLKEEDLQDVTTAENIIGLKRFKRGATSDRDDFDPSNINLTWDKLYQIHELDSEQDAHLLRTGYTTIEFYTYDGQQVSFDPAFLPNSDLPTSNLAVEIGYKSCIGYHNELVFYCEDYKTDVTKEPDTNTDGETLYRGMFLNNAVIINSFDETPVLVDNGLNSLAKQANQRALAESKTISNRINTVLDPNASLQDRFFNAASALSGGLKPSNIIGKFSDEYEFYRQQKAEIADSALQVPTITSQSNNSSFSIANNLFGLTIKVSTLNNVEWKRVKKYYKSFGYEINEDLSNLQPTDTMNVCNYVKFSGQWNIPNVNNSVMELLRLQCENGLRIYHGGLTYTGMEKDINDNTIVK